MSLVPVLGYRSDYYEISIHFLFWGVECFIYSLALVRPYIWD